MANDRGRDLNRMLERFRQRLRWLSFLRFLPASIAVSFGAATAAIAGMGRGDDWLATAVGCFALGVSGAFAAAAFRTPTLAATARIVDREFRLQDLAVSALQFSGESDPIARAIVSEAVARLGTLPARQLGAPRRLPAGGVTAAAVAVIAFLVVAGWQPERGSAGSSKGAAPSADAKAARESASSRPSGRSTPVDNGPNGPLSDARPAESVAENRVPDTTTSSPDRRSEPEGPSPSSTPSNQSDAAAGTAQGAREPRGNAAGRTQGESARSSLTQGPGARPGGTGRGANTETRTIPASGGVARGELTAGAQDDSRSAPPTGVRGGAAYAAAYARAESAIASEGVPPALRSYVRAYFLAIRPVSRP